MASPRSLRTIEGRTRSHAVALSIAVEGESPPSEFRIFTAGTVSTSKGTFTFGPEEAAAVMAEFIGHGCDLMVDYDHASLASTPMDPALASRAAGWFGLEVRNGELWAVNVRWTQPAADALSRKEWRFMSPAFTTDGPNITSLLNVALTNMPATRQLQPLMAAGKKGSPMNDAPALSPALVKAILAAVAGKDQKGALDLLTQVLSSLLGGSVEADEPAAEEAPAAVEAPAEEVAAAADPSKDEPVAAAAAARAMHAMTGKSEPSEALATIERWKKDSKALSAEKAALDADRAVLEASERHQLYTNLVTLAARPPATVWADATSKQPKAYLAAMSTADLREHVADSIAACGKRPAAIKPAALSATEGDCGLTPEQLAICKETGCEPRVFAQLNAAQRPNVTA